MDERLWTVSEVAKKLRVDETTCRRWITAGILEAISLPHKGKRQTYRIRQSAIDKIMQPGGRTP